MHLTVLVDNNTALNKQYLGEPGLSFYQQSSPTRIPSGKNETGDLTEKYELHLSREPQKVISCLNTGKKKEEENAGHPVNVPASDHVVL